MERKGTGAQALLWALEREGVDVVFGLPGGAALPLYDALVDSPIRHVLVRHEQGAGHAAEGYAHASGRPGVCFVTSGPGACNLVTPLADAMMDSIPLVAISGQVGTPGLGRDAFQETPVVALTAPVTKRNRLVRDPAAIPDAVREAFEVATGGRPGPVLLDIPKDVLASSGTWDLDDRPRPGPRRALPDPAVFEGAARLIARAERPVLYVGGGVVKAGATRELFDLATAARIPVVTTLMARGAFPDRHPLCLGMPGMHGAYAAVRAMQESDLLVALGARFDDRVTSDRSRFAPGARVIHADVDPSEIGKNRAVDVALVGDAKAILAELVRAVRSRTAGATAASRDAWLARLADLQRRYPFRYTQPAGSPLKPQYVIERLYEACGGDAVVVSGVGQHQMWTSQYWKFDRPRTWVSSGGLGTMGFAIPAAIGAKVARPDERVIAIDGDGCFQMTCQELVTAASERIPIVVAVMNNAHLGMVRQWQQMFHGGRLSQVELTHDLPDYVRVAEGFGCVGLRAETTDDVDPVIAKALSVSDAPVVIDFRVDPEEMCFPIVPSGASNDDILLGPEYAEERP